MKPLRDLLSPTDVKWLLAVVALALVVRLVLVLTVTPDPRDGRFDDTVWYDTTARHLAAGNGYVFDPTVWFTADGSRVYPDENELTPTALWPPGYSVVLAGIYVVTGDSVTAGRLANVLFGALTVALVFLIARRLMPGLLPAVLAGVSLALLPSHVLFTTLLLSETFFGFLLALIVFAFVYFVFEREPPSLWLMVGLGALTAFAGYVRGEFLAYGLVLALIIALHWRRQAMMPLATFALGAALIMTPWTVRNMVQMGEPIVGTTGAGRVMYQGHNPNTDGGPSLEATWELEALVDADDRKEIELETNREGTRRSIEWAWDNKLEEVRLVGMRMYHLFRSDESGVTWIQSNKPWFGAEGAQRLIRLSTGMFFGLIAFALASLPIWWHTRDARFWSLFAVVPFYMVTFGVLFIGDPRYHYALYIPLAVFAAAGMTALWRVTVDQWREVFGDRTPGDVLRTYGTPGR
jgi:4-amino-4-deoxy-L-arabinose transferase-like glycosyltransferase